MAINKENKYIWQKVNKENKTHSFHIHTADKNINTLPQSLKIIDIIDRTVVSKTSANTVPWNIFFEAGFRTPANMYIEELCNKGKPLKINNYINTKWQCKRIYLSHYSATGCEGLL